MLKLRTKMRRSTGRVGFDERTGDVCTPACRAGAQRDRDLERALRLHGPR